MEVLARYVIHFEDKSEKFKKILRLYHSLDFAVGSRITFNKKSYRIYDIDINVQKNIHSSTSKQKDLIDIVRLDIYCKL